MPGPSHDTRLRWIGVLVAAADLHTGRSIAAAAASPGGEGAAPGR